MKIENIMIADEQVISLQEIYCNTVLETKEGNQLAICMRDDTIEMAVVGHAKWYRVDMQSGDIEPMKEGGDHPCDRIDDYIESIWQTDRLRAERIALIAQKLRMFIDKTD